MMIVILIVVLSVNYLGSINEMSGERNGKINVKTIQNVYQPEVRHKRQITTSKQSSQRPPMFAPVSIINWNIEGIKYQLSNPEKIFKGADLVMLTETLNMDRPGNIQGYTCVASPAKQIAKYGRPVGGLTIYAKTHLNIRPIHISDTGLHVDSVFGHILVYYAHPSKSAGDIIGEICRDLRNHRDQVAIIGGDFNCRIETNSSKSETLLAFMSTIGFRLVNDAGVATFLSKHNGGASVIDLVFVKTDKVQGQPKVNVLRTPSKKHQQVFVQATLRVAQPELYELHRKIDELNVRSRDDGMAFRAGSRADKSKEKKKPGILGRLRDRWKRWFG